MTGFEVLTVSQLNRYVHALLDEDAHLRGVFLRGEISNLRHYERSGHYYLSLKDESAVVRAVLFRSSAAGLSFVPAEGMRVIARGRVSLYERDGQYQFYIDDLQPDGVGALYVAYEQLKERLAAEGLFDEARKRPLPAFAARVGVITSESGAVLHDIRQVLARRWPLAKVILAPVQVQGAQAPGQIAAAIASMNRAGAADVLIVGRGGGSIEDLWAFNDEGVARAIAASRIPVVSAVGHETDFTIADFAADVRAPTPSAAAELVSPDAGAVAAQLAAARLRLRTLAQARLGGARTALAENTRRLGAPAKLLEARRMRLDLAAGRLEAAGQAALGRARESVGARVAKLAALNPLAVLARGYAAAADETGKTVRRAAALVPGARLTLRFADGRAHCAVEDVQTDDAEKGAGQ